MSPLVEYFNIGLSVGTLLLQAGIVGLIVLFATKHHLLETVKPYMEGLAFLAIFGAMIGSLVYSNVVGYVPCELCWYQRIFLYPIAFVLGVTLFKKTRDAFEHVIALAIPGAAIASYHYYGQMFNTSLLECGATGVSCAQRFFVEFGYITMPLMSLTVFVFVIVCLVIQKKA